MELVAITVILAEENDISTLLQLSHLLNIMQRKVTQTTTAPKPQQTNLLEVCIKIKNNRKNQAEAFQNNY